MEQSNGKELLDLTTVAELLRRKGHEVITIEPDRGVREAVETLVAHGVGSLVVVEGERIVGVLTERDLLRANARHFDRMGELSVADLMTREVIIGIPEDTLEYVSNLMSERRIRHLPILSDGVLTGIISIGDVVRARARSHEVVIYDLKSYVNRQYPG